MTAQKIQQIAKYKQKIKDLISIIRYQEGYIDKLDETYCGFYNQYLELVKLISLDRTHYNEQVIQFAEIAKSFEANQKNLEEDVRKANAMLRWSWMCEEMDIDTENDLVKFTATKRMEYKNDFELDVSTKQLESGKRIEQLTLRKKKRPELKSKEELKNDK
jgi:hypothetical protein